MNLISDQPVFLLNTTPWVVGRYYDGPHGLGGVSSGSVGYLVPDFYYAMPFVPAGTTRRVGDPAPVDQLAIRVEGAVLGKVARLGLAAAGDDGKPGELLVDAGEVSVATTGLKTATIDLTLTVGSLYFRLVVTNGAFQVPFERMAAYAGCHGLLSLDAQHDEIAWVGALTYTAGVTVLPAIFPPSGSGTEAPRIGLRAA